MTYYESMSEEAERMVSDTTKSLDMLILRSQQLRTVYNGLCRLEGLVTRGKREEALDLIGKLTKEINP